MGEYGRISGARTLQERHGECMFRTTSSPGRYDRSEDWLYEPEVEQNILDKPSLIQEFLDYVE